MTTLKICGVPEHFNLPWHLCIESNKFKSQNIDLQWTDVPEGTGKMCQMLREGSTDIAVVLTEGIIKDIAAGSPSKIVQVYVSSPLIWGVHVAAGSRFQNQQDLINTRAAISRMGSGSQLMAFVHATNQGWPIDNLQFEVVNTLQGAAAALTNGTADYFLWEKFTTQPLVDQGIFKKIVDCPTPWPCFVLAVRDETLKNHSKEIAKIGALINAQTQTFKSLHNITQLLANRYHLKETEVANWLQQTEWSSKPLSEQEADRIQEQLLAIGIIDKKSTFAQLLSPI